MLAYRYHPTITFWPAELIQHVFLLGAHVHVCVRERHSQEALGLEHNET